MSQYLKAKVHFLLRMQDYHRYLAAAILMNRRMLREMGLDVHFYEKPGEDFGDAACVIVASQFFDIYNDPCKKIFEILARLRGTADKILWFDTADSTGTTFFDVLPLVDGYIKQFLLRDRCLYQKQFYMNRIWTDYYNKKFGITDMQPDTPRRVLDPSQTHKIKVGWSIALGDYGKWAKYENYLKYHPCVPFFRFVNFRKPACRRTINISARIDASYSSESISYQRLLIKQKAGDLGLDTTRIRGRQYNMELSKSRISISPFGWGEVCLRDFETIVNGAMLSKPDVSHMETWPDLFVPWQTYAPFKWDCSDMEEVIEKCLEGDLWARIASELQGIYHYYLVTKEGRAEFCNHFAELVRGRSELGMK